MPIGDRGGSQLVLPARPATNATWKMTSSAVEIVEHRNR